MYKNVVKIYCIYKIYFIFSFKKVSAIFYGYGQLGYLKIVEISLL